MQKYDFNNLTDEQKKEIVDAISFRDKEDAEAIAKRNEIIDALEAEYPFLTPRDYDDNTYDTKSEDRWCELMLIPEGWRRAFGLDLCKDLKKALIATGDLDTFRILQIKEKWGLLDIICNITTTYLDNVLTKYELLSERTCIQCGKPATKITLGWISPFCDKCLERDEACNTPDEYWGEVGREVLSTHFSKIKKVIGNSGDTVDGDFSITEVFQWNWKNNQWEGKGGIIMDERVHKTIRKMINKIEKLKNIDDIRSSMKELSTYLS